MTCMPPSTLASTTLTSWSVPQAAFESYPVTQIRHFSIGHIQVYPMTTGLIPGCLSNVIIRPLIIAR